MHEGIINQIIGPVIDIKFEEGHMPELLNAIQIEDGDRKIMAEVAQHVGDDVVRCVALSSTDGLIRGMKALDTGAPITSRRFYDGFEQRKLKIFWNHVLQNFLRLWKKLYLLISP